MPDQGFGGATAYVAFSDAASGRVSDDSQWIDCSAEEMGGSGYLSFFTHGTGVGDILIKNMVAKGAGIGIGTEGVNQQVRVEGGHIDDASVSLYGNGIVVDGVRITGANGAIGASGNNNIVQNVLLYGAKPETSYKAAAGDSGTDNVFQFNTIVLDPNSPGDASAFALIAGSNGLTLRGNIMLSPKVMQQWFQGDAELLADYNLFRPGAGFGLSNFATIDLAQWQAMGHDANSLAAIIDFINAAGGDYRLADGSIAIDGVPLSLSGVPVADFLGQGRPFGAGLDFGAFEAVPEPGSAGLLLATAAALLCRRRRRS
jgi:hypothetical protein